jgi:uncharacterized lipoprotein YbaY
MRRRALLTLSAVALLHGCGLWPRGSRVPPEITGTVTYREAVPFPGGAEVRVTLYESTGPGSEPRFIAEQILYRTQRLPVRFRIPLDPRVVDPKAGYTLVARIESGTKLLFVNPRPVPVLTLGNPSTADIVVSPAPAS